MKDKKCGCNEPILCGCEEKIDLLCTFYSGENLDPLPIRKGDDGNKVIKKINDYLRDVIKSVLEDQTVITSVGEGHKIYKGLSSEVKHEIKSILKGEGIVITEQENTITISVDKQWLQSQTEINFQNIGIGESVYVHGNNSENFKRLRSTDDSINISSTSDSIDFKSNVNAITGGQSAGDGIPLFKGVSGDKIVIASVQSNDISITEVDGVITFKLPGSGTGTTNSSDWYLDTNYIRPENWGTSENPKEEIVDVFTAGNPIVKIPKGTLNDPFISYKEYLLKRIYGVGGTGTAPFSKWNPSYPYNTLQILSSFSTSLDLEVIGTLYYFKNGSTLTYTGTRNYALDTGEIFDNIPLTGGKITRSVNISIRGEGSLTRENGFGLIRHKTDKDKTTGTELNLLHIIGEGNGLNFVEGTNAGLYTNATSENGTSQLYNGSVPIKASTQAPVHALIKVEGVNNLYWGAGISGTKVFIRTKTQRGIHLTNKGSLTSSADKLMYQFENSYIGYKKKLYQGLAGMTTEEQDILDTFYYPANGNGKVFYLPHDDYEMFRLDDDCQFRVENLSTEPNGFTNAKGNSVISLGLGANFNHIVSWNDVGGGGALNFVKTTDIGINGLSLNSLYSNQLFYNIFKATVPFNLHISFGNSRLVGKYINSGFNSLVINTVGTISALNNKPMISMEAFATKAAASSAGLIEPMIFKNSTTGEIQQV